MYLIKHSNSEEIINNSNIEVKWWMASQQVLNEVCQHQIIMFLILITRSFLDYALDTAYQHIFNLLSMRIRFSRNKACQNVQGGILFIDPVNGPLTRYEKIAGYACAGNVGNVSPPPRVSDPDMHHGTCVTHVTWCMPGSLTSGFLWSRWRGKRSRHFRSMRNPQFCVSGKRPMLRPIDSGRTRLTTWQGHWQVWYCLSSINGFLSSMWTYLIYLRLFRGETRSKVFHVFSKQATHDGLTISSTD